MKYLDICWRQVPRTIKADDRINRSQILIDFKLELIIVNEDTNDTTIDVFKYLEDTFCIINKNWFPDDE